MGPHHVTVTEGRKDWALPCDEAPRVWQNLALEEDKKSKRLTILEQDNSLRA